MNDALCCDDQRRIDVANSADLNGIDFLEVVDVAPEFQQTLRVHFLRAPAPTGIGAANVRIGGGERITGIVVDRAPVYDGDVLVLHVDRPGDFSLYTLALVRDDGSGLAMEGLDPVLSSVRFSFKVSCPSPFDCAAPVVAGPAAAEPPGTNYLARDYAGFRQLMLDRLAATVPEWAETNPADLGIALVEVLAYVADHLSYQQDAVATEAYLGTARLRTSVRRHARLVDYRMHEGCNARTLIAIEVADGSVTTVPAQTPLIGIAGSSTERIAPNDYPGLLAGDAVVFETIRAIEVRAVHNVLPFHTWGDRRCRLPTGSTKATLAGRFADLKAGDVLILEERKGPRSGLAEDADPAHRQAVRLVSVSCDDVHGQPLRDPLYGIDVTEIAWHADDALAFPLWLSVRVARDGQDVDIGDVGVALGNVVLADHGRTLTTSEALGTVPQPTLFRTPQTGDPCRPLVPEPIPPRFRPALAQASLTWAVPDEPVDASQAASLASAWRWLHPDLATARPTIVLTGTQAGAAATWSPQLDLLASHDEDRHFVVEPDDAGYGHLRFGDGTHGRRPAPGTAFVASYRVGSGVAGNVGPETLRSIVTADAAIVRIHQPLAAVGGTAPETIASVRTNAPVAFRTQQRAVTPDDYARVAAAQPGVQSAAATMRWTGSWRSVFVTVDPLGRNDLPDADRAAMIAALDRYRMAGHDVEVETPVAVPLEITMRAVARPDVFRAEVARALARVFGSRTLPNGRPGYFQPDNFRIGQDVYASPLYAAAMGVDGVASVEITVFQRRGEPATSALATGVLPIGRLEVARLDNDPDFPERGLFTFTVEGGK